MTKKQTKVMESPAAQQLRLLRDLRYKTKIDYGMIMPGAWQRVVAETLCVLLERTYVEKDDTGVPRVATGVKNHVDRLRSLGNGIVPAVVAKFLRG